MIHYKLAQQIWFQAYGEQYTSLVSDNIYGKMMWLQRPFCNPVHKALSSGCPIHMYAVSCLVSKSRHTPAWGLLMMKPELIRISRLDAGVDD